MRGTLAVIAMVLLVVLAAHMQREENRRDDDVAVPGTAYRCPSPCESATADVEADAEAGSPDTVTIVDTAPPSH